MDEKTPLFAAPTQSDASSGPTPIWKEKKDRKTFKLILAGFMLFIIFNIVLSILLVSIQSWRRNKIYLLLLVSLLLISQVPFFLVLFIYKEYVSQKHFYAVFVTGIVVALECIATDILVFN